jgi:hypothetical protein
MDGSARLAQRRRKCNFAMLPSQSKRNLPGKVVTGLRFPQRLLSAVKVSLRKRRYCIRNVV